MLLTVSQRTVFAQPQVAFFLRVADKMPCMDWGKWHLRLREKKRQAKQTDANISSELQQRGFDVGRATVNHWLHDRRPVGLKEFFALCEILGADPGEILFEAPVLPRVVTNFKDTKRSIEHAQEFKPKSSPPSEKARAFKRSRAKVRRK